MNPNTRLALTLGAALLIWAPGALLVIDGELELSTSGLYFIGALLLAYVATGVIGRMNQNYRNTAHRVELAKRQIEQLERRNRRRDDPED